MRRVLLAVSVVVAVVTASIMWPASRPDSTGDQNSPPIDAASTAGAQSTHTGDGTPSTAPPTVPIPLPAGSDSEHEIPLEAPPCESTITSVSDWDDINDPSVRVWCVAAGDYRSAGVIDLTMSGSPDKPRWIRYISVVHPARRSDQAIVLGFALKDVDHWTLQGLTQQGGSDNTEIRQGSDHNIFDRMLFEGGTNIGQWEVRHGAHHNTLQNSVLRSSVPEPERDNGCVWLNGINDGRPAQVLHTRIVGNEIYDCAADAIALSRPGDFLIPVDFSGTIIDDNDLYVTTARLRGTAKACAENAVDVKAGGSSESPVVIRHNRMWGFRETDESCGGTGSRGDAVNIHSGAQHVAVTGNVIWDVDRGVNLSDDGLADGHIADTGFVYLVDNIIWSVSNEVNPRQGSGLRLDSRIVTVQGNTVTGADAWGDLGGDHQLITCNAFIDSGEAHGSPGDNVTFVSNAWLNTPPVAEPPEIVAVPTTITVTVRRWTGPATVDVPAADRVC